MDPGTVMQYPGIGKLKVIESTHTCGGTCYFWQYVCCSTSRATELQFMVCVSVNCKGQSVFWDGVVHNGCFMCFSLHSSVAEHVNTARDDVPASQQEMYQNPLELRGMLGIPPLNRSV